MIVSVFSFNSTTVQLIPYPVEPESGQGRCFNSTTVQLIHRDAVKDYIKQK